MSQPGESAPTHDPHDLARFLAAQRTSFDRALAELKRGRKESHWMWYVFPQVAGLGHSPTAERYAIQSRAEAAAYLAHPVLGPRLRECAEAVLAVPDRSASQIFGYPDDLKLRSSATLFEAVSPPGSAFARLLDRFFQGERDQETLRRLGTAPEPA